MRLVKPNFSLFRQKAVSRSESSVVSEVPRWKRQLPLTKGSSGEREAQSRVGLETAALLGIAVADAEQRLVVLDRTVLARERARTRLALGDVFVGIHAPDEGVKALVDPRQRQVHLEAQARLEAVELVVEQRGCDRPAGSHDRPHRWPSSQTTGPRAWPSATPR